MKLFNKKDNFKNFDLSSDISYLAPLNIRHLRVIAWGCLALTQVVILLKVYSNVTDNSLYYYIGSAISLLSDLALPLFLLASFAYIIQRKENYFRIITNYFCFSIAVIAIFYLLFYHYGENLFYKFAVKFPQITETDFNKWIYDIFGNRLSVNIFIDLLLCSVFAYFVLDNPKKHFQGRWRIVFRLFALLPILYEIGAICLRFLIFTKTISVPLFVFPLLPTKAPLTFLAFVSIVLLEKQRKIAFYSQGGTKAEYKMFFKSNRNSLLFAKSSAKVFAVFSIIDTILLSLVYVPVYVSHSQVSQTIIDCLYLGKSADLLILAPFVLLFSYNKIHKPSRADIIIPLCGIGGIVLIYLETAFQVAMRA